MSEIVAIICEYNPFHNGHKYQIDKIREQIPDATIIAIMSGNATQRGELAFLDKYTRARVAIEMGVNAVFELPYPFSSSNAEMFACAGVKIADALGADRLCFGTESGNLAYLDEIANTINTPEFESLMQSLISDKRKSYISAKEAALEKMGKTLPKSSNDILAVEYLRAIKRFSSSMKPFTIKRNGADYNDTTVREVMSASAIRKHFYEDGELLSMPQGAVEIFKQDIENGFFLYKSRADDFFFRYVLMSNSQDYNCIFDAPWESGYFILDIAKNSSNFEEFFENLSSKTYTTARLKRVIMYLVTGVKKISMDEIFTMLLACDDKGREIIKANRKKQNITILTKQADVKRLSECALEAFNLSKKIDELFFSLLKNPKKPSDAYRLMPFVI